MTIEWQSARSNRARGWRKNIAFWLIVDSGRKGFFHFVAVMNVLCLIFAYLFGARGDMIVTFYAVVFRESTYQQSHLNDFHTDP
jgi:hypothetical protein